MSKIQDFLKWLEQQGYCIVAINDAYPWNYNIIDRHVITNEEVLEKYINQEGGGNE